MGEAAFLGVWIRRWGEEICLVVVQGKVFMKMRDKYT